ncbi:flagellar motor switch protein FliM [mine drainage metagenome]|uniref:Flagellar motor switch protein FliM n=1 Tax=mine drainage metagenome TaxID=410659 RepID=A0A1J5Q2G2_9ZZZZ
MSLETFTRQWATLFTMSLRAVCNVSLKSIQQLTYDEYISSLPDLTAMFLLSMDPLPGSGIVQLSMSSVMTAFDHMLGGSGAANQPARPLTEVESTVIRGVVDRLLHELRYALEALVRFSPEVTGVEHNPQFAQAAAASDLVLVTSFEVHTGIDVSTASICLPFNGIFPYLERAISGPGLGRDASRREAAARAVALRLEEVPVDVAVRFRPTSVLMPEVLDLRVGDVLPLRHPVRDPLTVGAAGITFAHAVPGSEGRRLACLIVTPTEESTS